MPKVPRRDVVQHALLHLPIDHALNRVERSRKAASVWCAATTVFGGLLWLWLQAPGFNLLPAALRAVLSIVGFLGYGLFGFTNPMVVNAADYINIGYGIVAGPPIMTLVALAWWQRERRLADELGVLADHPVLAAVPPAHRRLSRVTAGFLLAALALLGSTGAATLRFFDLRAAESEFLCANEVRRAICKHDTHWALPWPDADKDRLGWLRPHVDDWCVKPAEGWPPGFQAVLPGSDFTRQIAKLGWFECVAGQETPRLEGGSVTTKARSVSEFIGGNLDWGRILEYFLIDDPYKNFPYVYPILNVSLFALSFACQLWLLSRIVPGAGGNPRLRLRTLRRRLFMKNR